MAKSTFLFSLCLVAVLLTLLPGRLTAQWEVEVAPYAGFFIPTTPVLEREWQLSGFDASSSPVIDSAVDSLLVSGEDVRDIQRSSYEPALALGGSVTVWRGDFGLGLTAFHSSSRVESRLVRIGDDFQSESGFNQNEGQAEVTTLIGRLSWRSAPSSAGTALQVGGGLGLVSRGGEAFEGLEGTTDLAAAIGAGLRLRASPVLSFRLAAEDHISRVTMSPAPAPERERQGHSIGDPVDPIDRGPSFQSRVQHDLVISMSVLLTAGGH